jgi:hypothetical protein
VNPVGKMPGTKKELFSIPGDAMHHSPLAFDHRDSSM